MATLTYAVFHEAGWFEQVPVDSIGHPATGPASQHVEATHPAAHALTTDLGAPETLGSTAHTGQFWPGQTSEAIAPAPTRR
jgi:hypothetical protein